MNVKLKIKRQKGLSTMLLLFVRTMLLLLEELNKLCFGCLSWEKLVWSLDVRSFLWEKRVFLHRFVLSPLSEGTKSNAVVVQKRNCSTHKVKKIYEKKLLKYFKFGSSTKCYLFTVCFRKPFFEKRFKILWKK